MRKTIFIMACVFLIAAAGIARADTLYLGSHYNEIYLSGASLGNPVGGGPVSGATLNGYKLPYIYCIGLYTDIYVPGTYSAYVNHNGTVNNGTPVTNANKIAWLLTNYASSATDADEQKALQAAIWHEEYSGVNLDSGYYGSGSDIMNDYITEITAVDGASISASLISNFDWITPYSKDKYGNTVYYQPQVTAAPEPSTIFLVGFGLLGLVIFRRRITASVADSDMENRM